jgi:mannose-6-phosphate isomerase-like protein (cupin superfamily)
MTIYRNEMKTTVVEKLHGGTGSTAITHMVDCTNEKNIRMLAEVTLQPGASIGRHSHQAETEYYVIVSGTGTVDDDGRTVNVQAGDTIVTGNSASHSISNTGAAPLVFHAIIVTH